MPVVQVGNPQAIDHRTRAAIAGQRVTTFHIDDSYPLEKAVTSLVHADGAFSAHSVAAGPAWVESNDPELAEALAVHWGCPVGRNGAWKTDNAEVPAPLRLSVADPSIPVVLAPGATRSY
jgi:hypothetical protein